MSADYYSTKGPICPNCEHQHQADEPYYYDEGTTELDCECCDFTFPVRVFTQTSWTTGEFS